MIECCVWRSGEIWRFNDLSKALPHLDLLFTHPRSQFSFQNSVNTEILIETQKCHKALILLTNLLLSPSGRWDRQRMISEKTFRLTKESMQISKRNHFHLSKPLSARLWVSRPETGYYTPIYKCPITHVLPLSAQCLLHIVISRKLAWNMQLTDTLNTLMVLTRS
jgi:hypothetical protein